MNAAAGPRAPAWLARLGNFAFRWRDLLFPVILLSLVLLSPPFIDHRPGTPLRWLDAAGILVALAGQALRVVVVGYRYIVRGGKNKQVYAEGLVTTGVFALSRNPLYVGNLLIMFGLFVVWGSALIYVVGVPLFLLFYRAIVAAEEDYLGRQYGAEFDAYCAAVPRWLPRLGLLGDATRGIPFNWRRVILKEYGSAAYWMAGALVMLSYKEEKYAALAGRPARVTIYVVGVALVVVMWACARFLKKTKRLVETPAPA